MKIEITGDDAITHALQRLRDVAGSGGSSMMLEISETLRAETMKNFDAQGRPDTWTPLAESTLKRRPDRRGGKILQDKQGGLLSSITADFGADYAEVRTNKVYGRIHQFGGKAGRNHAATIPARPYFVVTDEGWDEIMLSISRRVDEAIG
ncbi:MAG: phage virion morphogenesis protein [Proteobacteria bacterium]|nr:phage virion morphogenesis protein [Pseudomonadota bacterium]MCL2306732.1 phage virion morphogenesis protein [Pseudomonadota bacterium]